MLAIHSLSKNYEAAGGTKMLALDNVSVTLEKGSFTVLIGSNGSGKSSLIKMISGTEKPDKGSILLHGKPIHEVAPHKRAAWIGNVFQDPKAGTAGELTILENLRLASIAAKKRHLSIGIQSNFREEMQLELEKLEMGLEMRLDQPMQQLSGGQRQAVSLMMAWLRNPDVLLLDEPTAALDPKSAQKILEIANTIISEKKLTALLVTHNMSEAVNYGDRLLQMHQGRIVKDLSGESKQSLKPIDLAMWFQDLQSQQ